MLSVIESGKKYRLERNHRRADIGGEDERAFFPMVDLSAWDEVSFRVAYKQKNFCVAEEGDTVMAVEAEELSPYQVDHVYEEGDTFVYDGEYYQVLQDHTSQEDWPPDETSSLYTTYTPQGMIRPWEEPEGAHDAYQPGDVVKYEGELWKCVLEDNVWAPDVEGWEQYEGAEKVWFYGLEASEDYPKGGLEFELEIPSKPDSNVFSFDLESEGLSFQRIEERDDEEQPEHIKGAYSVRPTKPVAGKTGTFSAFLIYRPQVVDADGNSTWADLSIDGREVCITVDDDWLDSASYPVYVDPTFGYTDYDSERMSFLGENEYGGPGPLTSPDKEVKVTKLGCFLEVTLPFGGEVPIQLGLYGEDKERIAQTDVHGIDYEAGELEAIEKDLQTPVHLSPNTECYIVFWMGEWPGGAGADFGCVSGEELIEGESNELPSTISSPTSGFYFLALWAVYEEADPEPEPETISGQSSTSVSASTDVHVVEIKSVSGQSSVTVSALSMLEPQFSWQAMFHGEIEEAGKDCTRRGFVYDVSSYDDPGDVSPENTDYAYVVDEEGDFSAGTFSLTVETLDADTTYYVRAFAENADGITYSGEEAFTTEEVETIQLTGSSATDVVGSGALDTTVEPVTEAVVSVWADSAVQTAVSVFGVGLVSVDSLVPAVYTPVRSAGASAVDATSALPLNVSVEASGSAAVLADAEAVLRFLTLFAGQPTVTVASDLNMQIDVAVALDSVTAIDDWLILDTAITSRGTSETMVEAESFLYTFVAASAEGIAVASALSVLDTLTDVRIRAPTDVETAAGLDTRIGIASWVLVETNIRGHTRVTLITYFRGRSLSLVETQDRLLVPLTQAGESASDIIVYADPTTLVAYLGSVASETAVSGQLFSPLVLVGATDIAVPVRAPVRSLVTTAGDSATDAVADSILSVLVGYRGDIVVPVQGQAVAWAPVVSAGAVQVSVLVQGSAHVPSVLVSGLVSVFTDASAFARITDVVRIRGLFRVQTEADIALWSAITGQGRAWVYAEAEAKHRNIVIRYLSGQSPVASWLLVDPTVLVSAGGASVSAAPGLGDLWIPAWLMMATETSIESGSRIDASLMVPAYAVTEAGLLARPVMDIVAAGDTLTRTDIQAWIDAAIRPDTHSQTDVGAVLDFTTFTLPSGQSLVWIRTTADIELVLAVRKLYRLDGTMQAVYHLEGVYDRAHSLRAEYRRQRRLEGEV